VVFFYWTKQFFLLFGEPKNQFQDLEIGDNYCVSIPCNKCSQVVTPSNWHKTNKFKFNSMVVSWVDLAPY
jgi:hypothetical protein